MLLHKVLRHTDIRHFSLLRRLILSYGVVQKSRFRRHPLDGLEGGLYRLAQTNIISSADLTTIIFSRNVKHMNLHQIQIEIKCHTIPCVVYITYKSSLSNYGHNTQFQSINPSRYVFLNFFRKYCEIFMHFMYRLFLASFDLKIIFVEYTF